MGKNEIDTTNKDLWYCLEVDFKNLTGDEFEKRVADLYRKKGYHVRKTPIGADDGVDLIARKGKYKMIIQAKNWTAKVGSPQIRDLAGTRELKHANYAIIITSSTFTPSAFNTLRQYRKIRGITINGLKKEFRKYYHIEPKQKTIYANGKIERLVDWTLGKILRS